MVLESQDAIQSIEQIFREDAARVERMINRVEQDIIEQPENQYKMAIMEGKHTSKQEIYQSSRIQLEWLCVWQE